MEALGLVPHTNNGPSGSRPGRPSGLRIITSKIPQLQKSEIDDRENENESRLFCQIRLPGESFDMVGVDFLL